MEVKFDNDGVPYVIWGESKIQLETKPDLDEDTKKKAVEELRETPELVQQALEELRQLLKGEQNLHIPVDRDDFLIKFLRPCKFYAESAYKRILMYYKFRQSYVEQCRDLMPSATRKTFEAAVVSILSPRDQHGRRILLIEAGERWNPREIPLTDVFRGTQMGLEGAIKEPKTQINGVIAIFDMKGLSFSHVMQFTPSFAKMLIEWIQDCVPIRLKAVHIVNQPYIFNMLFALFKPFMRDKLRSRIHFHGTNRESLLAHVDASALRKRHGGALPEPEIPGEVLFKMLSHYEEDFKVANSFGFNNKDTI